jgi:hypothetical protein
LLSNCCQPHFAAGADIGLVAPQAIEITEKTLEPTSGLEPLTCSLRDGDEDEE